MKKLITLLSFTMMLAFGFTAEAQYCGSAHSATCGLPAGYYGFGPLDSIACVPQGTPTTLLIPFKNYNQFTAGGNHVVIKKLKIDSLENLPNGLCWSTNKPTNEFLADEDGCFQIQGITSDAPGEYKCRLILAVATQDTMHYDIPAINANAGNVYLYIRVSANGVCAGVDTASAGLTPSGETDVTHLGVRTLATALTSLTIQPNPMSGAAKLTFASDVAGAQLVRIINIVGSEVYNTTIDAKVGMNETTITRGNLPAGIYILSVGNAKGTVSRKFVISE